jgi:hypothetical protein
MSTNRGTKDRELDFGVTNRRKWWLRLAAPPGLAATVLCLAGAALLVVSAVIHLHLWSSGYRHIPTIGPLFILQGIAGIALALVVAITRRAWAALAGAGFAASTIAGLLLSVEVGLFGFKDSLSAPDATLSLVVESAALVVLAAAALVGVRRPGRVG